jgi:hypothetical protein
MFVPRAMQQERSVGWWQKLALEVFPRNDPDASFAKSASVSRTAAKADCRRIATELIFSFPF